MITNYVKASLIASVSMLAMACTSASANAPSVAANSSGASDAVKIAPSLDAPGNVFVRALGEDDREFEVKVLTDDSGEKKIWINGDEATPEELAKYQEKEGHQQFVFKSGDRRLMKHNMHIAKNHMVLGKHANEKAVEGIEIALEKVKAELDAAKSDKNEERASQLKSAIEALESAKKSISAQSFSFVMNSPRVSQVVLRSIDGLEMDAAAMEEMHKNVEKQMVFIERDVMKDMADLEEELEETHKNMRIQLEIVRETHENMEVMDEKQLEALKLAEQEIRRSRIELEKVIERKKDDS